MPYPIDFDTDGFCSTLDSTAWYNPFLPFLVIQTIVSSFLILLYPKGSEEVEKEEVVLSDQLRCRTV